jgi:prepilin-type N-terminal cleavage/methylation domain-containing protein
MRKRHAAFTLIELLIVVAIIAILAAIAVPNFLEAQMRAKVTRCKADMRAMQTGMEAYRIDNGDYIPDNFPGQRWDVDSFVKLTTPVAYLPTVPISPFIESNDPAKNYGANYFEYWRDTTGSREDIDGKRVGVLYRMTSWGPNGLGEYDTTNSNYPTDIVGNTAIYLNGLYDATNGTKSRGDLMFSNRGVHNN